MPLLTWLRSMADRVCDAIADLEPRVKRLSDGTLRIAGIVLIAFSFFANPTVLGRLLSPDGRISMPRNVLLIFLFQLSCAAIGFILTFRTTSGRRWLARLVALIGRDWIPDLLGPYSGEAPRAALALRREAPVARWEWAFIILLVLGSLAYWAAHYNYYHVPNADYGSFDEVAERIWEGRALRNYKRMPTFPILMGLAAKFVSTEPRTLHGGLLLNMGLSAASLVLIFLIARRCIGWLAIFPVVLVAAQKHYAIWATQPIAEACILFFLLLALFLFQRKSLWQYAAAMAGSMARYDTVAVIPILCLLNLIFDRPAEGFANWKASARRRLMHVALALVASAGILFWVGLAVTAKKPRAKLTRTHDAATTTDSWWDKLLDKVPYGPRIKKHGLIGSMDGWVAVTAFAEPFNLPMSDRTRRLVGALIVAALFLLGAYASLGLRMPERLRGPPFRRTSLAVLLCFAAYLGMHVVFGMDRKRYAYPTLWIVDLYVILGLACLAGIVAPAVSRLWNRHRGILLGVMLLPAARRAVHAGRQLLVTRSANPGVVYFAFAVLLVAVLIGYCLWRYRKPAWVLFPAAVALVCWPGLPVMKGVRRYAKTALKTKYEKYEYLLGARWLEKNLREGERAVLTNTGTMKHYTDVLTDKHLTSFSALDVDALDEPERAHEQLIRAMVKGNIRYLIFTPRSSLYDTEKQASPRYLLWKVLLLQPFKWGGEPPGFRRVHTFQVRDAWAINLAHVYEVVPDDPRLKQNAPP